MYSVAVIGAGPTGLRVATILQRQGFDTVVLEEHSSIGMPVNCGGLISRNGVEELGLNIESCLVNEIRGAEIYSPDNEMIKIEKAEPVAYVIDRKKFDRTLYKEAVKSGVEVRLNTRMIDIRNESIFVEHGGRGELLKAKVIVGADGYNSKTRSLLGIDIARDKFVHTFQANIKGVYNPNYVKVFLCPYIKDFFGWMIPESSDIARVGIGTAEGNPKEAFDMLLADRNINQELFSKSSSLIPIGEPLNGIVNENVLLAGDAAFHTKATTGGGIISGISAADACAAAIVFYLKNNKPLENYEKNLKPLNKELKIHWKIRSYLNSLPEQNLDKLFVKLKKAKIEEFLEKEGDMDKPTKFVGKLLRKPSMWKLLPELLKFMRT